MSSLSNKILRITLISSTAVFLSSCSVKPKPITLDQHLQRVEYDTSKIYENVNPLIGELTLSDAISRGLLFNLDHKMVMMERVLQEGQLTLANFNMLPRLASNAGYKSRNKLRASKSIGLTSGTQSLEDSYSEERDVFNADLTISWNLLDFGLSYYQARQQADRVMASVERRRKVMNNMVKEVMVAYWKASSAEQLLPRVEKLLNKVEGALSKSEKVEKRGLQSPMATLEYRRNLLQTVVQLKQLRNEMIVSKAQLASLINLPLDKDFKLAKIKSSDKKLPNIKKTMNDFQNYGLVYRPELREEAYQENIDRQNVKKEILRMFPGLAILGSANHDSNSYLYYQNWREFTTRATWNLINVIQGPEAIKNAKTQVKISEMRRLALTAAIMGQISIGYSQYHQAFDNFNAASKLSNIEQKMLKITESQRSVQKGSELDRIQISARSISAELDEGRALVDAKTSLYNLMVSVGADFIPADTNTKDLKEMTGIVSDALTQFSEENISQWIKIPERSVKKAIKIKPQMVTKHEVEKSKNKENTSASYLKIAGKTTNIRVNKDSWSGFN